MTWHTHPANVSHLAAYMVRGMTDGDAISDMVYAVIRTPWEFEAEWWEMNYGNA